MAGAKHPNYAVTTSGNRAGDLLVGPGAHAQALRSRPDGGLRRQRDWWERSGRRVCGAEFVRRRDGESHFRAIWRGCRKRRQA